MYIIALDPGGTVGWASFESPNNRDGYHSGQFASNETWAALSSVEVFKQKPELLIVESFQYRSHLPKVDLTPVEVIGVVKEWAVQNEVPIVWQTPAQAKFYFTNERLKELHLHYKGHPHANDAMRHLLYYLNFVLRKGGDSLQRPTR